MIMLFCFSLLKLIYCTLPDKCMNNGVIAITFDDGPTAYTAKVLDQLDSLGVKATFHFTVQNVVRGGIADLMRRAVEEGHTVGLRVNPKRNYEDMDAETINDDIKGQLRVLTKEIDQEVKFARAPAPDNIVNDDVYDALKKQKIIQSSYSYCFYHDAEDPDEAISQLEKILETSSPEYESFIFLLHEEMEKTFPLLEEIVKLGNKKKYSFVTMDECLEGYKPGSVVIPGNASTLSSKSGASSIDLVPFALLCFLIV